MRSVTLSMFLDRMKRGLLELFRAGACSIHGCMNTASPESNPCPCWFSYSATCLTFKVDMSPISQETRAKNIPCSPAQSPATTSSSASIGASVINCVYAA